MASASLSLAMIAPSFFPAPPKSITAAATTTTVKPPFSSSSCAQQDLNKKPLIPSPFQFRSPSLPNQPNPNPVLIDVQEDCREDSVLFSFGIAEQCTRHEQILRYLMSGSASPSTPDHLSQLCHLLGFQPCGGPLTPQDQLLLLSPNTNTSTNTYTSMQMQMHMPQEQADSLAHFLRHLSACSLLSVDPAGRILFSGSPAEMKDLLSILAEFDFPMPHHSSKVSLLVPYFDRTRIHSKAANKLSVLNFPTETVAPSKSTSTNRTKSTQKKRQKKNTSYNRDIFQKNYFHTCESLLSLLLDKSSTSTGRGTGAAIHSMRKLGPEMSRILTSFSIGIAGTGLAVLLSVACKMAGPGTRVPLSATRVLNTGFGLGLFWLCWAVNGLRDTIVQACKGSNKLKTKDEEIALKVERSMKEVLFRAGALVALAALRFA